MFLCVLRVLLWLKILVMAKRKKQGAYMISAVVVTVMLSGCGDSLCANEVISEIASPNGSMKIVVFERNCGATTGFSTQGSLLRVRELLPDQGGNVFVSDGYEKNIQVEWDGNDRVTIRHPAELRFYRQEKRVGRVAVSFAPQQAD